MTRRKPPRDDGTSGRKDLIAQQDQSEVLEEVGATLDEESGELVAPEERVREIGAVDADAVRENERMKDYVSKKRGGVKNVTFNTDDPLLKYETLLAVWPANTIDIFVRRLTGSPVQHTITSRPRSGAELYEAMKVVHGVYEEASYELKFADTNQKVWRGSAKITMPDTRNTAPQGQPPMTHPYYPPGYAPPPPPGYAPIAPAPAPVAPAPAPAPVPAPPQPPPVADLNQLQQLFDLFRQMQQTAPTPPPQAPPQPVVLPPPPTDPAAQMAWMRQAFEMFQRMQAQPSAAQPQPPLPPVVVAAPPPPPPPPQPAPSGLDLAQLQQIFQLFREMMPQPQPQPTPTHRRPYDPRERGYDPRGYDPRDRGYDPREQGARGYEEPGYAPYRGPGYRPGYNPQPQQAQPVSRTPVDEFREAVSVVRTAVQSLREVESILPGGNRREVFEQPPPAEPEDDSPVQVVDAGPAKFVVSKDDGAVRGLESVLVNLPGMMKWGGEQWEKISKMQAEQRQQQAARQQLPPGYVEVTPGYQPPPGYIAVPVDQDHEFRRHRMQQQHGGLPDPPAHMPPPLHEEQITPIEQPWGPPPSWGGR